MLDYLIKYNKQKNVTTYYMLKNMVPKEADVKVFETYDDRWH